MSTSKVENKNKGVHKKDETRNRSGCKRERERERERELYSREIRKGLNAFISDDIKDRLL